MEDFITAVFCFRPELKPKGCIDDQLRQITHNQRICSRGFEPSLSDSEVMMMESDSIWKKFGAGMLGI